MALSGTFTHSVGSWWQLRLTWTATQNVANNTSTITSKFYWEAIRDGVGLVTASSTKTGYTRIDGSQSNFSSTATLAAGGSKLLHTQSKIVTHDADGTLSTSISGMFDLSGIYLSGVNYGTESVSGNITLNTIPRESSLSSGQNWTAGSNDTISVKRYSTAFSHTANIAVMDSGGVWQHIKTISFSTSQTSLSTSFSVAENTEIFQRLNGRTSAQSRIILTTLKGTTTIGSNTYTGTVTAPANSTTSFTGSFDIGDTMSGTISRQNSAFTHTIQLIFTGTTYTLIDKGGGTTWSYDTDAIAASLYAKMGTNKSLSGVIRIYTYYAGVQVRSYAQSTLIAYVPSDSNPTFSSSQIAYRDINTTTTAITGNNQYIIQNKSTFQASILSGATAKNGATISQYIITVNGVPLTKTALTAVGDHTIGSINASTNINFSVKVVDSRGFSTTVSKTVAMVPYNEPNLDSSVERINGFESSTILSTRGSLSPLNVAGVTKNSLSKLEYQYRQKGVGSYSTLTNLIYASNMPNFSATDIVLNLDNLKEWEVKVIATDRLGSTSINMVLQVGQPILFIDSLKKAMGFNDFPQSENEFRINGQIVMGQNMWNNGANGKFGAIDMRNSDMVGINAFYFNDVSNSGSEGFMFLKTGKISGSTNPADYDNFYMADGVAYANGKPVFYEDMKRLWSGGAFMFDGQSASATKELSECPNGWVLVWSEFASGSQNYGWQYTFIPKSHTSHSAGGGIWITGHGTSGAMLKKYVYVTDTQVNGHTINDDAPNNQMVLRYIYSI